MLEKVDLKRKLEKGTFKTLAPDLRERLGELQRRAKDLRIPVLVVFEGELTAETAYKGLMDAGYIVRWLPGQGLPHALRITIGTEDETRGVVATLNFSPQESGQVSPAA